MQNLQFNISKKPGEVVNIKLKGTFSSIRATEFKLLIFSEPSFLKQDLQIDFCDVQEIDNTGIKSLIEIINKMDESGYTMSIKANPNRTINGLQKAKQLLEFFNAEFVNEPSDQIIY